MFGYNISADLIIDWTSSNNHFFDWDRDGVSDHVGIVEKCENGRVYTVEGNSGDEVRQEIYMKDSKVILGYGVLAGARK